MRSAFAVFFVVDQRTAHLDDPVVITGRRRCDARRGIDQGTRGGLGSRSRGGRRKRRHSTMQSRRSASDFQTTRHRFPRRPGERRDPYAVTSRFGTAARRLSRNNLGLWYGSRRSPGRHQFTFNVTPPSDHQFEPGDVFRFIGRQISARRWRRPRRRPCGPSAPARRRARPHRLDITGRGSSPPSPAECCTIGVFIRPGRIAFTLMWSRSELHGVVRVIWFIAALDVA